MALCGQCELFSAFVEPRDLSIAGERFKNMYCYGVCYKQKIASGNFQGYPVFLMEGRCDDFIRRKGIRKRDLVPDGQLSLQFAKGAGRDG